MFYIKVARVRTGNINSVLVSLLLVCVVLLNGRFHTRGWTNRLAFVCLVQIYVVLSSTCSSWRANHLGKLSFQMAKCQMICSSKNWLSHLHNLFIWNDLSFQTICSSSNVKMANLLNDVVQTCYGQFHCCRCYIQTQFWNFNIAQTKDRKELSSFPFMTMFVPTDTLTGLYNFSSWLISIREI